LEKGRSDFLANIETSEKTGHGEEGTLPLQLCFKGVEGTISFTNGTDCLLDKK
jgi:hypothetical protein